ncbi:MAG TPA: dihydrofolate reductase family protein [Microlunatus sp.]|nr:dihydrofolate reductase family protein [Microlunatus sp.]
MGNVIVLQFITLDGVIEDPDGRSGTPRGGWSFRFGTQAIAGDVFRLGPVLQDGALLFGRRTWEHFSRLWPARSDPFSARMNALPKYVVSRRRPGLESWSNSRLLDGDLVAGCRGLAVTRDVVVIGSTSIIRQLTAAEAVDEYRLLTFPSFLGGGARLFDAPVDLELVAVSAAGPATLATYRRGSGDRDA